MGVFQDAVNQMLAVRARNEQLGMRQQQFGLQQRGMDLREQESAMRLQAMQRQKQQYGQQQKNTMLLSDLINQPDLTGQELQRGFAGVDPRAYGPGYIQSLNKPFDYEQLAQEAVMLSQAGRPLTPEHIMAVKTFDAMKGREQMFDTRGRRVSKYEKLGQYAGVPQQPAPIAPQRQPSDLERMAFPEQQIEQPITQPAQQPVIQPAPDWMAPDTAAEWEKEQVKQFGATRAESRKEKASQKEKNEARQSFERQINLVAEDAFALEQGGGIPIEAPEGAGFAEKAMLAASNPLRALAGTEGTEQWGPLPGLPGGQDIARAFATKNQRLRDQIGQKVPLMFMQLRKSGNLTGKELDSLREREFYLNALFKRGASISTVMEALENVSQEFGTGGFTKRKTGPKKGAVKEAEEIFQQRRQEATGLRPGTIKKGHVFLGGDPSQKQSWKKVK